MKSYVHAKTWKQMFISALYVIAKNLKTTQESINWWREKQNVAYPYDGLLLNNTEKEITATFTGISEPQKDSAKLKKPGAEDHTLYYTIDMKFPEKGNL